MLENSGEKAIRWKESIEGKLFDKIESRMNDLTVDVLNDLIDSVSEEEEQ